MSSCSSCHMMCRASLAPAVNKLSCSACEACSHICITKGKNRSLLVYALSYNEFEVSVFILGDRKVCHRTCVRIELCQISTACFAMEYFYDLHGWLLVRDVRVTASGMSDNTDIIVEVDGVHLRKLTCTGNCL